MNKLGRVLMLDDDLIVLNLYHGLLEKIGYEIFVTANTYQFLLYAKELKPDVFILDINMPKVTGWEVLHRLEKDEALSQVPVVVMSVLSDKALAIEKGAAHYLSKPVKPDVLFEILETYCIGNRDHDVLLLEDFSPAEMSFKNRITKNLWSCFEVNDVRAAKTYLQKNMPKVVAVHLPRGRFLQIKKELKHPQICHLESYEQVDELEELIK